MNLYEAQDKLEEFLPQPGYLANGTIKQEKQGEENFYDYLELKTRIFDAKRNSGILELEFALEILEDERFFFNLDILPTLYKDFVPEKNIDYCKVKLLEIESERKELIKIIEHRERSVKL